jgi:hypothetical protein
MGARPIAGGKAARGTERERQEVNRSGGEDDRRAGRERCVVGGQQARDGRDSRDSGSHCQHPADGVGPEARSGGGQDHDPDGHQRAKRLKPSDKVQDHKSEEQEMHLYMFMRGSPPCVGGAVVVRRSSLRSARFRYPDLAVLCCVPY